MRKFICVLLAVSLLAFAMLATAAPKDTKMGPKPPAEEDKGQNISAAMPNLSFPVITTSYMEVFYQKEYIITREAEYDESNNLVKEAKWEWVLILDENGEPIPIDVVERIVEQYTGEYPPNTDQPRTYDTYLFEDGCLVFDDDGKAIIVESIPMEEWLPTQAPWYGQPIETTSWHVPTLAPNPNDIWNADFIDPANVWQAEWTLTDQEVTIDFIDWGNPLEMMDPVVGQRFPIEVTLYKKLTEPMTAYKSYCIEYEASRDEYFGISKLGGESFTRDVYFATVITSKFHATITDPTGKITETRLDAAIGPGGRMNFASAGGGWTPEIPGVHRVTLYLHDPLINISNAYINDWHNYILTSENWCKTNDLNKQKLAKSGITCSTTYINVMVVNPNGGKKK